jgi:hypothetical protein
MTKVSRYLKYNIKKKIFLIYKIKHVFYFNKKKKNARR